MNNRIYFRFMEVVIDQAPCLAALKIASVNVNHIRRCGTVARMDGNRRKHNR